MFSKLFETGNRIETQGDRFRIAVPTGRRRDDNRISRSFSRIVAADRWWLGLMKT
jgi:hypothetical protein